jgi:hypothetical protein
VPRWADVPGEPRRDLSAAGCGEGWFDGQEERIRLTVLILYVKLHGARLWPFVGRRHATSPGSFEFAAADASGLRHELRSRRDFRVRGTTAVWDALEKRATGALHLKHFRGWPAERVQAHVDAAGLWLRHPTLWWAGLPITGLRHLAAYRSYRDVHRLRRILLDQGCDRALLLGAAGPESFASRKRPRSSR